VDLIKRNAPSKDDEPPKWKLAYFEISAQEARSFLTEEQYEHAVEQFEELALEEDPTHPKTADVRSIEGFHELRDKGGVLGKINLRVYFSVCKPARMIVVLGAYKKESEAQTPNWIVRRIKQRQRLLEEHLAKEGLTRLPRKRE